MISVSSAQSTVAVVPAVSICMPTYRGAAHLAAAIDSVLAQTFTDFELVILDDNSPDNTGEIVTAYRDSRIRYLRNPRNLGPQGNWNRCLDEARGTYFKLMPQDDLLDRECLAVQVAEFEADPSGKLALVFGARDIIDAQGTRVMRRAAFGGRRRQIAAGELIRSCVRRGTNLIGEPGNVLLRRDLIRRVGAFDGTYGYVIDLDYWFRALQFGDAMYLPGTLSSFRISSGSWSVAIGSRQYQEFRDFLRSYQRRSASSAGRLDFELGVMMAYVNAQLRRLVYRGLLRKP